MRVMVVQRAVLAILFLISPVFSALHLIYTISVAEYVERRIAEPEERFPLFGMDAQHHQHVKKWQKRLLDLSAPPVGPCRLDPWEEICKAPPYPLFPVVPDSWRNPVIQRPPPDVVRNYIQKASNGELSTVQELVGKTLAHLEDLSVLRDDEITLLATNFREPKTGLTLSIGCGPKWYGDGWPEDLLKSEEEQRAQLAGFLHAIGDEDGYVARQFAAYQEYARAKVGHEVKKDVAQQCLAATKSGASLFQARVDQLDAEVLLAEEEWLARYEEYVAALRADLFAMVPRNGWDRFQPKVEEVISAVEDDAEKSINENIPKEEPGYCQFFEEERVAILGKFPGIRHGIVRRFAYRRWNMLSHEKQAGFRHLPTASH